MSSKELAGFTRVARLDETPVGEVRTFDVGDESIAICNYKGSIYAISNICTHDEVPLGSGKLLGCEIECPRHGARFDIKTGEATAMPAAVGVDTYETKIIDNEIYVRIDAEF